MTPDGIVYVTSYAGTPIYVTGKGKLACTVRGEWHERSSLSELKRLIKADDLIPKAKGNDDA